MNTKIQIIFTLFTHSFSNLEAKRNGIHEGCLIEWEWSGGGVCKGVLKPISCELKRDTKIALG